MVIKSLRVSLKIQELQKLNNRKSIRINQLLYRIYISHSGRFEIVSVLILALLLKFSSVVLGREHSISLHSGIINSSR